MMMSEAKALELGLPILARIRAFASVGVDPALMGIAPVHATRRCLERAGWRLDDVDLIEANEAFAAQAISVGRVLEWDERRVNVNGGAIALGHPIGASGCRILVSLVHEMIKRDARKRSGDAVHWRRSGRSAGGRTRIALYLDFHGLLREAFFYAPCFAEPLFFPPSFTLPGEIIELRHVLLCHLF